MLKNFKDIPKYMFASVLAGVAAYGYINSIEHWQAWLIASVLYLAVGKFWSTVMD